VIELAALRSRGVGRIAGRVVDQDDKPLVARVHAVVDDPAVSGDHRAMAAATSNADGSFAIEDLDAKSYDVSAHADGFAASTPVQVEVSREDVVLRLARGNALRGEVRDRVSGAPIPAFSVMVWRKVGAVERGAERAETFVDPNGAFEVDDLASG